MESVMGSGQVLEIGGNLKNKNKKKKVFGSS